MTLTSTLARQRYTGTGLVTTYPCNFRVLEASHLIVSRIVAGTATVLAYGPDYTIASLGAVGNASVVLTTPLALGAEILMRRSVPLTQPTDLRNQGAFYPEIHEDTFDRMTMILQQQEDAVSRSLQLRPDDADGSGAYDANGNRITGAGNPVEPSDLVTLEHLAGVVIDAGGGGTDTIASASFASGGVLLINVVAPTLATVIKAAISEIGPPSDAAIDAAVGTLTATANQATLQSPAAFAVGATVYVAVRSFIGGVGGRVQQLRVSRDAEAGSVAVGPSLEAYAVSSSTQTLIYYTGTGTITVKEGDGAYAAPAGSPLVYTRAAAGSGIVTKVTLRAVGAGQTITNAFTVDPRPTVDTDTVTPNLTVTPMMPSLGSTAALHQQYTVTATNPKAGGPVPTIQVFFDAGFLTAQAWDGASWIALTTGQLIALGAIVRVLRPAFGVTPQTIKWVASLGVGQGEEEIGRSVMNQDVVLPTKSVIRQTPTPGFESTRVTLTVTTASGLGTVRWTGGGTRISGALLNVEQPSGSVWVFERPGYGTGNVDVAFTATVNGVTDPDVATLSEVGRDTIGLLTDVEPVDIQPTFYVLRLSCSNALRDAAGTVVVSQLKGITCTRDGIAIVEDQTDTVTISTSPGYILPIAGFGAPSFRDYVVSRPAVGSAPGRFLARVTAAGFTSDADGVDIQPQDAAVPGRVQPVSSSQSGADFTFNFRVFRADGVEVTYANVSVTTTRTIPLGAVSQVAETPTYNSGLGYWTVVITRPASVEISAVVTLGPDVGTARTEFTLAVPPYVPAITIGAFINVPTTYGPLTLNFAPANAPVGATYDAIVTTDTNGTNYMYNVASGANFAPVQNGKLVPGGGYSTPRNAYLQITMKAASGAIVTMQQIGPIVYHIAP